MPDPSSIKVRRSLLPSGASLDHLSPGDVEVLLSNARLLRTCGGPLEPQRLLRGRNLALMCESADDADAMLFQRAATALGAHVSHLRPSLSDLSTPAAFKNTARMLGRLYQGIECQDLPADLVGQVGREAGIPAYDGVASPRHPVARLASLLDGGESVEEKRQLIVQAVLVSTLG